MNLFQVIFAPTCFLLAVIAASRTVRGKIGRRQGLLWFLIWGFAGVSILRPSISMTIAAWFGIARGADLVFYLATITGLFVSLMFFNRQRRLETILTVLVRKAAVENARLGQEHAGEDPPRGNSAG